MAQRGLNKVMLIGYLGADPDVRTMQTGDPVTTFSLATSETWTDQQGGKQERTEWHRVVLFGKVAEVAGQYLHKGSQVYVEGQLRTRKWSDQQGIDRYTTEVVVSIGGQLQMLGKADTGGRPPHPAESPAPAKAAPKSTTAAQLAPPPFDDDIPF